MDLNYLLFRHQVSLSRASSARLPGARDAHRGLADGYARQIRRFQTDVGAVAMLAEARA